MRDNLKALYKDKKDLFGLAFEFNMLPARYIHRSWIESFIPFNIFKNVAKSKRGAEKISNLILAHYKLNYEFYYEFYDPSLRFALLPSEIISKLAFYSGIALNYKFITKAIDKQKKTKIIESIGQRGYRFAVAHAPLLVGEIKIDINLKHARDDYKGFVEKCGAIYFLSSLAHAPRSLISRLRLKFPKGIDQNQDLFNLNEGATNQWLLLRRIMMQVIDPRWHQLFT